MPPVPADLQFAIPSAFMDMVLYNSGPGDDRMIMMGCAELLDGLARAGKPVACGRHFQGRAVNCRAIMCRAMKCRRTGSTDAGLLP